MKKLSSRKGIRAFTVVELVIVIAVIAVLAAMLLPTGGKPPPTPIHDCMTNLKQVNIGFMIWASEHTDRYPWEVSTSNNGTKELISGGHAFPHFQTLSNYVGAPKITVCPSDKFRTVATNYEAFSDRNLSYFVNLDATIKVNPSTSIVAGDRHLQADGTPVKPGLFLLATNMDVRWTRELHDKAKGIVGNVVFADGHAETLRGDLNRVVRALSIATNRLAVP